MKKSFKALFISLLLHSMLFGAVFYVYETFYTLPQNKDTTQTRVHISLNQYTPTPKQIEKTIPKVQPVVKKKKITKKVVKKKPKKQKKIQKKHCKHLVKKKKVIYKKKVVPKKEVVKKEILKELPPEKPQPKMVCANTQPEEVLVLPKKVVAPQPHTEELPTEVQTTPKPLPSKVYIDKNMAKIQKLLQENLYYPRKARKRGIEGEVVLRFHLDTNAQISEAKILKAPHPILSRGALKTLEDISGSLPKPQEDLDIQVPIMYHLH